MARKIVRKQTESVKDLKANPRNPRTISKEKQAMLLQSLKIYGDLSGIIDNRRTGNMTGGNQRGTVLPPGAKIVRTTVYKTPTAVGTVSIGYVLYEGEQYAYREVDWDEATEHAAMIAANQHGGMWSFPLLTDLVNELDHLNIPMDLLGFDTQELKNLMAPLDLPSGSSEADYTKKIESPIYEPKGPKPAVTWIYDPEKAFKLIDEIQASDLPEEEKTFLKYAAYRHIVFDYEKIAEFYSHSSAAAQRLMENSALVIIDFNKAIEKGFVVLSEKIAAEYQNEEERA